MIYTAQNSWSIRVLNWITNMHWRDTPPLDNARIEHIAKIIGRTPDDLSDGCDAACETDGGTCICIELHRNAAIKILDYISPNR